MCITRLLTLLFTLYLPQIQFVHMDAKFKSYSSAAKTIGGLMIISLLVQVLHFLSWKLKQRNHSLCIPNLSRQKQPPRGSVKKGVLRNFANFTEKHLCQSLFFNKVSGLSK